MVHQLKSKDQYRDHLVGRQSNQPLASLLLNGSPLPFLYMLVELLYSISSLSVERILAIQFPSSLAVEDCICIVGNLLFLIDLGIADNSLFEISIKLKTSPFKDGINSLAISQDPTFYVHPICSFLFGLLTFFN